MRNSVLITSDLKSIILVDTAQEDQRLAISKRGILLNVLANDVCATEVPAELETFVINAVKNITPFFSHEFNDLAKSQLCITYNDANNVVFIIGITDIVASLAGPAQHPQNKVTTFAVKMKDSIASGMASKNVILARLETTGTGASMKKFVRFYYAPV